MRIYTATHFYPRLPEKAVGYKIDTNSSEIWLKMLISQSIIILSFAINTLLLRKRSILKHNGND